jgi:ankyrin repeat protein
MLAATEGHADVVQILLEQPGIKVNARRNNGSTALMEAASNDHAAVVQALLAHPGVEVSGSM